METLKTRSVKEYRMEIIRVDFSLETMKIRRQWNDTVKVLKEKTVNQEFYVKQNYLSKIKVKNTFPIK